jgi:hypothetical protein
MTSETPVLPTFRHLTTWHLANLAGCGSPDRPDGIGVSPPADLSTVAPSPGALFLRSVADDLAERIAYVFADLDPAGCDLARELEGEVQEVADAAPSVYTFTRWQEFTDLAAWQEDATELGASADDLTGAAGVALYVIAERLALALVESWGEELAAEVDA